MNNCQHCKIPVGAVVSLVPEASARGICGVCEHNWPGENFIATHLGLSDEMIPLCHKYKRISPRICKNCGHASHYSHIPCGDSGLHDVTAEFATIMEESAIGREL